jgi:peptidoglycan/xylan/chitin deacetylase (PgdA/CDA1 family)/Mrp family chromosome partitioning ATPase
MNPRRLATVLWSRWPVIAIVAILAAAAAVVAVTSYNQNLDEVWESTAPVTFLSGDGESENAVASRLQSARQTALSTTTADSVTVAVDEATSQLRFVARAPSRTEAMELAETARTAYLTADPSSTLTGQIEANLRRLEAEAATLRASLGGASIPSADPTTERLRNILIEQLGAQIQRVASLRFQISFPTLSEVPVEELQAQLAEAEALVAALRLELQALPTVAAPEQSSPSDLETLVLQRRLEMVQAQYVDLALRLLDLQEAEGFTEPALAIDQTPQPIARTQAAIAGALLAAMLAVVVLMIRDRARRPVLSPDDIESTVLLAEVHGGRPGNSGTVWYASAPQSRRQQDIQTLRASLEPGLRGSQNSVALVGASASEAAVQTLAADLAASLAATDRRVLLIDANLSKPAHLTEYDASYPDLRDVLTTHARPGEDLQGWMKETLVRRTEVSPGLISLRAGAAVPDAADRLSAPQFRMLLGAAADQTDVVVAAAPDRSHPAADVVAQHVHHVVLVAERNKTTTPQLSKMVRDFTDRGVGVAGVVLLVGGLRRRSSASKRRQRTQRSTRRDGRHTPGADEPTPVEVSAESEITSETPRSDTDLEIDLREPESTGRSGGRQLRVAAKAAMSLADIGSARMPGPRIVIYHQIGVDLGREMEVPTDVFIRQLDWMESEGMIAPLPAAVTLRSDAEANRLFVLTFDDGYRDLYTTAFPILAERGLPFTLYLTTHPVETGDPLTGSDQAAPLTWDQVSEMLESGLMTLGAHTHRHVDLREYGPTRIAAELDRSNQLIEKRTGVHPRHFAYPWGYWSEDAEPLVRVRYDTATLGAGPPITEETDLHRLHRIPVQRSDGMTFFRRKLATGMQLEEKVRRRIRGYEGVASGSDERSVSQ